MITIERGPSGFILSADYSDKASREFADLVLSAKDSADGASIKRALLELLLQKGLVPRKYLSKTIEIRTVKSKDGADEWIEIRCDFIKRDMLEPIERLSLEAHSLEHPLYLSVEADVKSFLSSIKMHLEDVKKNDATLLINSIKEPVIFCFLESRA